MLRRRITNSFFLLFIIQLSSPSASSQQLAFTAYNRSSGLPSDYILCMYQDRQGFIWFGTDRGVCRYDGSSFITFTVADGLGSNFVRRIFEDAEGNIWFGLIEGGVTKFDGDSFKTLTTKNGLSSDNVLAIHQDLFGRMYFKTNRGVSLLVGREFVNTPTAVGSPVLARLADGSIVYHDSLSLYRIIPSPHAQAETQKLGRNLFSSPATPMEARLL